jgi:hypothetical protein
MFDLTIEALYDWLEEQSGAEDALAKHLRPGLEMALLGAAGLPGVSDRSLFIKCLRAAFLSGIHHGTEEAPSSDDAKVLGLERAEDTEQMWDTLKGNLLPR